MHAADTVRHSSLLQDYENSKPAPDCFLLAAEKIGVPPELCVGYEDAVLGMEAIRQASHDTRGFLTTDNQLLVLRLSGQRSRACAPP